MDAQARALLLAVERDRNDEVNSDEEDLPSDEDESPGNDPNSRRS